MLNDLCGAMWLTYFLIFFHQVLEVDAKTAGYLLLVGQITDGLATPLVGIESDRLGLCRNKYGRRKSWHLMGTACVALSFVFIYTPLPGYIPGLTPLYVTVIYYVPFIVIFHIGWAATQVAHLSIIPDLTYKGISSYPLATSNISIRHRTYAAQFVPLRLYCVIFCPCLLYRHSALGGI